MVAQQHLKQKTLLRAWFRSIVTQHKYHCHLYCTVSGSESKLKTPEIYRFSWNLYPAASHKIRGPNKGKARQRSAKGKGTIKTAVPETGRLPPQIKPGGWPEPAPRAETHPRAWRGAQAGPGRGGSLGTGRRPSPSLTGYGGGIYLCPYLTGRPRPRRGRLRRHFVSGGPEERGSQGGTAPSPLPPHPPHPPRHYGGVQAAPRSCPQAPFLTLPPPSSPYPARRSSAPAPSLPLRRRRGHAQLRASPRMRHPPPSRKMAALPGPPLKGRPVKRKGARGEGRPPARVATARVLNRTAEREGGKEAALRSPVAGLTPGTGPSVRVEWAVRPLQV